MLRKMVITMSQLTVEDRLDLAFLVMDEFDLAAYVRLLRYLLRNDKRPQELEAEDLGEIVQQEVEEIRDRIEKVRGEADDELPF